MSPWLFRWNRTRRSGHNIWNQFVTKGENMSFFTSEGHSSGETMRSEKPCSKGNFWILRSWQHRAKLTDISFKHDCNDQLVMFRRPVGLTRLRGLQTPGTSDSGISHWYEHDWRIHRHVGPRRGQWRWPTPILQAKSSNPEPPGWRDMQWHAQLALWSILERNFRNCLESKLVPGCPQSRGQQRGLIMTICEWCWVSSNSSTRLSCVWCMWKSDLAVLHFCKSFISSLPLINGVNLQSFGNGDDDQMILAMEHFLSASAGSGQVCLLLHTAHFRCHFSNQSIADPNYST